MQIFVEHYFVENVYFYTIQSDQIRCTSFGLQSLNKIPLRYLIFHFQPFGATVKA